ncbi:TetR/AcrR family transcriptional regulator [Ramlibacter sp. G-1-2-2]|uniref:TetR/AcrR family transcriptional regulator n=1 Tax=Ramlibacter agri TaxID=2728837 RepID=A0A848H934_9BURK|nr:TetR/AcrR family transcriptional regulator [Ramlibacter agri]NML47285.1 TetR/AcrR family transcriptional regulator [Ramlibacter agri]
MARPKQFDPDDALDAAVAVFRDSGYAGASAEMLTAAMQIGKQSLYNTFGGKWALYLTAVGRYAEQETAAHLEALNSGATPLAGLEQVFKRVVAEARTPCLGVSCLAEFGSDSEGGADLRPVREAAGKVLRTALAARIREAQAAGDLSADTDALQGAGFLVSNIAAIRLAARGGAGDAELRTLARLALRALQ